ncbi:sensor histidine kinase [Vibrio ostreicida]|uniref:histidine kinase n=1 Tax=Vibrio ostreicida TaxID=526588 RepID=A0ABT8BZ09_9VIBR|nr:ATP-binding protein [Vibrio ostreicida]MDN3612331.1 ATP-binding protein [Vibrio ostreicida]NPD08711.1 hypothetical protein [Vibrio ostreicida]
MAELLLVSQSDENPTYFEQIECDQCRAIKPAKAWLREHNVGVVIVNGQEKGVEWVEELVPFIRNNLKNHFLSIWVITDSQEQWDGVDRQLDDVRYYSGVSLIEIRREVHKQQAIGKTLAEQKGYLKLLAKINKFNRSKVSANQVLCEFVNELDQFCNARQTYVLRQSKQQENALIAYKAQPNGLLQPSDVNQELESVWQQYQSIKHPDIKFSDDPSQRHSLIFPVWILERHSCTIVCQFDHDQAANFTFSKVKVLEEAAAQLKIILENMESQRQMKLHYSRLKTSMAELSMAKAQLVHSEKMASLGRLTAGIAHEINNPLGIALGNLSPLTDYVEAMMNLIGMHDDFIAQLEETGEAAVPDQIANYKQEKDVSFILEDLSSVISDSRSSLLRVKSIVSDLSSLSQGMESERESCCLKAICDEVVKLNFYENDLQPRIDNLIGSDIELESNSALLKQVFSNLHVNALEALEINCDDPSITYRCEIKHEQLYVTIEDNGCGIPSDKINQVVDPFFTTKPLGDGKGLGLTVACNVVNGLGGDLSLESLQGKGTKVMVSLPLKAEQGERVGPNSVKA